MDLLSIFSGDQWHCYMNDQLVHFATVRSGHLTQNSTIHYFSILKILTFAVDKKDTLMKWLWALLLFASLLACRSEQPEIEEKASVKADLPDWPKSQDDVNIDEYYDTTLTLDVSILGGNIAAYKNGSWGVIDDRNQLYFEFSYDTIISNSGSVALKKMGNYEIYDTSRTLIAEIRSEDLYPVFNNFYAAKKQDKWALINPNGLQISNFSFDRVTGPKKGEYFLGEQGGEWLAYDLAGTPTDTIDRASEAIKWIEEYRVGLKNYGPLNLGRNLDQIERALGYGLRLIKSEESCQWYDLGDDFLNIDLLFKAELNGSSTLERIDIQSPEIRTKSGIGIRSTKKDILDAYGSKIVSEPSVDDKYEENLLYVPSDRKDKAYRLKFRLKADKVKTYSIGRIPSIMSSETCP